MTAPIDVYFWPTPNGTKITIHYGAITVTVHTIDEAGARTTVLHGPSLRNM